MKNGETVKRFEEEFAAYVGARFAIALNSGTSTLHTALVALGVRPGEEVAVPPLTMSSTAIAVLQAGAVPVFRDVFPDTWTMQRTRRYPAEMPVSLYGLSPDWGRDQNVVDDAAQTLRQHSGCAFTSYSLQASKILSTGEGGMLVTNDEELAQRAREFSSLGYRMRADQPRIDPAALKSPTFDRHYSLGWNYRMADAVASLALTKYRESITLPVPGFASAYIIYEKGWDGQRAIRTESAAMYFDAISGCDWLTPQLVPDGWKHDYWTFAVACDTRARAEELADAVVHRGGERPYPCWRLTFDEPAFRHLDPGPDACPVARSLQPRLLQFQTNDLTSAETNARALRQAIEALS